ncbi:hypothetical protein UVI_02027730 [Ustilaginoidea virens]|uniref:Uncharacterized protein n=1 Tax=Ustilaginoidea virens TaxID=1159556 RepID=A0A1B5KVN9_USTVR|nr:hypothetical protein UVI_02027730 [Ustilaginoidea virens]
MAANRRGRVRDMLAVLLLDASADADAGADAGADADAVCFAARLAKGLFPVGAVQ